MDLIFAAIYSELLSEGTTPVAWATTRAELNLRDMMSVALKSISLMSDDDQATTVRSQPRAIINETNGFGIIPFPDQDSIAIAYLIGFTRARGEREPITATLCLLAPTAHHARLIKLHEPVKQLMKYHAYEILKIVVDLEPDDARPRVTTVLEALLEKVNRLGARTGG